jgi:hypothetical protein
MTTRSAAVHRVEIFEGRPTKTRRRRFYVRAKARNGEIVAQSEGYTRGTSARRAARRLYPTVPITP